MSDSDRFSHVLVPRHELLSKEESEKVLKELGVKLWQLPRISQDDPAIRGLGAEVGQLVRITRKSDLMGEYVVYRLVVPPLLQKSTPQKPEAKESSEEAAKKTEKVSKRSKRAKSSSKSKKGGRKSSSKSSSAKGKGGG